MSQKMAETGRTALADINDMNGRDEHGFVGATAGGLMQKERMRHRIECTRVAVRRARTSGSESDANSLSHVTMHNDAQW